MNYCFDLDGTICDTPCNPDGHGQRYLDSTPISFMVETVDRLYDEGNTIIYWTARGSVTGIDWKELTEQQKEFINLRKKIQNQLGPKPPNEVHVTCVNT